MEYAAVSDGGSHDKHQQQGLFVKVDVRANKRRTAHDAQGQAKERGYQHGDDLTRHSNTQSGESIDVFP